MLKKNVFIKIIYCLFSVLIYKKPKEIEGVQYIRSKRGTDHVLYDGNAFTPNEKNSDGQGSRTWKCSMYYKLKCRARITTRRIGLREFLKPSVHSHNHAKLYPTEQVLI